MSWDEPVVRQSEQIDRYKNILIKCRKELGLFECNCSRRDIKNALTAPHENEKLSGPDGIIYPGTCRGNMFLSKLNFENVLRMHINLSENKSFSFSELGKRKGEFFFFIRESEHFQKNAFFCKFVENGLKLD